MRVHAYAAPQEVLVAQADAGFAFVSEDACEALLAEKGKELPSKNSGRIEVDDVSKLPDPIKKIVVTIPLNTASEPIVVSSGVIVLMVCNRSGGKITKDTRDQVRRMLLMKRAELLERSMLRDIQRSAFLEIRR